MKTTRDAVHDSLVATYQSLEASILNRTLQENGVQDAEQRRTILAAFLFKQGVVLDQCWFTEQGQRWYPGVYFSTKPHDQIDAAVVHLPSEQYGMNFYEYANGAADWAIENDGNPEAIEVGNGSDPHQNEQGAA